MTLLLAASLAICASSDTRTVDVGIRYSRFLPDAIEVGTGTTVTFMIHNDDPIPHEFILGTTDEQLAHERGTEITHDGAPGAASLEPGETTVVTYTFDEPGTLEYACHLPGHYTYGMRGTVTIR